MAFIERWSLNTGLNIFGTSQSVFVVVVFFLNTGGLWYRFLSLHYVKVLGIANHKLHALCSLVGDLWFV